MLAAMRKTSTCVQPLWVVALFAFVSSAIILATPLRAERHRAWRFSLTSAVSVSSAHPAASSKRAQKKSTLDKRIDKILCGSEAHRGSWGLQVVELGSGKLRYERNADQLFIPASNMKMFTTAAALEKLGPGYIFHTTVETGAAPDAQGRVGDVYSERALFLMSTMAPHNQWTSSFRNWQTRLKRVAFTRLRES